MVIARLYWDFDCSTNSCSTQNRTIKISVQSIYGHLIKVKQKFFSCFYILLFSVEESCLDAAPLELGHDSLDDLARVGGEAGVGQKSRCIKKVVIDRLYWDCSIMPWTTILWGNFKDLSYTKMPFLWGKS